MIPLLRNLLSFGKVEGKVSTKDSLKGWTRCRTMKIHKKMDSFFLDESRYNQLLLDLGECLVDPRTAYRKLKGCSPESYFAKGRDGKDFLRQKPTKYNRK